MGTYIVTESNNITVGRAKHCTVLSDALLAALREP